MVHKLPFAYDDRVATASAKHTREPFSLFVNIFVVNTVVYKLS